MNIKLIHMKEYNIKKGSYLQISILLVLLFSPSISMGQWHIISHENLGSEEKTKVAYTENKNGYSLEIYKDSVGSVRARFTLNSKLNLFSENICPTYQVDLTLIKNTSFNDAPCISK
ncbi:MAG TPA: hypothetical protein DDX15_06680, partial [Gammaproteobacteria bacterium]|nr:hypothetical protein [Gammaproteobacteria bacterium]